MKTNNRNFINLRYVFILCFLIEIIVYQLSLSRHLFFICHLLCLCLFYFIAYLMIVHLYNDMRKVIQSFHNSQDYQIQDGDLGILYDEIRQLQRRTQQYEKTIEKEKMKLRDTIEDICHQMKTPLTSIGIYNELLENEYHLEYVQETGIQIDKMKYLVNTLLTLAKIESHQIHFDFQKLPIKYVIDLSLQSLHSLIEQSQVHIHVEDKQDYIYYDESWLQEAFSNIFKNNIEHGCSNIEVSFQKYDQYIKVKIYNDGPEINTNDLPHIFERFYHTDHQKGVGIGLALTKEIIHRHHSEISVYNEHGVVFEILFPIYLVTEKHQVS